MLAFAALSFLQVATARPVTFDAPAMPLARLLPALGAKAGVEIVAAPSVAKDVVLLRVKDKPLGEILKRLADEDGAEVEATTHGLRLVRTPASERKERNAALARRIASLRPALDATREALRQPSDEATDRTLIPALLAAREKDPSSLTLVTAGRPNLALGAPATRAAMRATLALPVEMLADLREGDRVVFSNRPTKLQREMPALTDVLQAFATEQDVWAKAASRFAEVKPSQYRDDPLRYIKPLESPPARAVLILSRGNSAASANVRLVIVGAKGEGLGSVTYSLQTKEMSRSMDEFQKPTDATPVPTSTETATLIEGVPHRDGTGPKSPSRAAIELLSHPETHDPLGYGATDLVRDMAGDRPVVAVLPDMAWFPGLFTPGGLKRSDRTLLAAMVDSREEEGWLLVRPREPEIARQDRVDRAALGRFVRAIVAVGRVPLDDYAEYAWTASDAPSDMVGVPIAMLIDGSGTFNPDASWRLLRLFGSLSPSDRKTLLAGGRLTWEALSPAQQGLAEWVVLHGGGFTQTGPRQVRGDDLLSMEWTEIYADGFDALEIKLSSRQDSPLLCDSTTKNVRMGWRRTLDPSSVGSYSTMDDGPRFDRFGIASRTTYSLSLSAKRGVMIGAELEDIVPPTEPLRSLAELPEAVRKQVEASIRSAASQNSVGGGRVTP